MQRLPFTDENGEVRELTAEDFSDARPIAEQYPQLAKAMKAMRTQGRRPRVETPKIHVGFRWAPDLVASIKAGNQGYNARIEQIVRQAFQDGPIVIGDQPKQQTLMLE